jgi:hypothetical protein
MFNWWQILIIIASGLVISGLFMLAAVFLGGILVFKTKTITQPTPFFMEGKQMGGKAQSYVSNLYTENVPDLLDDSLSPAAARLREQKKVEDIDDHKTLMERITGKK